MTTEQHTSQHRDFVAAVHQFNVEGQTVPPDNTFNADRVCFYTGMQFEELAEKLKHIAEGAVDPGERRTLAFAAAGLDALGKDFKSGKHRGSILRADREALLDDDIDIAVVTIGALVYQTPHARSAMDAVANANDAKRFPDGKYHNDPDTGKILKPEGWKEADLSPFIVPANT